MDILSGKVFFIAFIEMLYVTESIPYYYSSVFLKVVVWDHMNYYEKKGWSFSEREKFHLIISSF